MEQTTFWVRKKNEQIQEGGKQWKSYTLKIFSFLGELDFF